MKRLTPFTITHILKNYKKLKLLFLTFLIFIISFFIIPFYMPFMPQYTIRLYFNSTNTNNYKLYEKVTTEFLSHDENLFKERNKSNDKCYIFFVKPTKMNEETLKYKMYEVKRYNKPLIDYTENDILFYNIYGISTNIDEIVGPYITLIRSNDKNKTKWIVQGIGY